MEHVLEVITQEPIVRFVVLLVVILTVPTVVERFRLPGLVGLLAAGVVLGPYGLGVLDKEAETMKLLSDIGLVYLMFVAGLEIDIEQFHKTKHRSIGFGFFTFIIPLIFGIIVGRAFGFGWNASVLIGSLFASHTLLAYPIVSRLGLVNNEAVIVTIGATIFTDIGSLLVLAVCIGIHAGNFTIIKLITLFASLTVYSLVILFGFDWLGKEFFRQTRNDEGNQFLFVLMAVFLAALGAQLIGVEKIVGAFLAGIAVNDAVGEGPVKEKVVFVGSVLFIPIFFVDMGLLINIPAFIKTLTSIGLTAAIVFGLISSKFFAALLAKLFYKYNWQETLTMWSLSLPQVAATLAATLVGYKAQLLTEDVLNSVIVLMLVTATLGPVITSKVAPSLITTNSSLDTSNVEDWVNQSEDDDYKVVVPVYNPQTEQYLIEMAAILARHRSGEIVPLAIAIAHSHMDAPQVEKGFRQSESLLNTAKQLSQELGIAAEPLLRIDDNIAQGICRASREQKACLIVMGWAKTTGFRARLFGNIINNVLWGAHCQVAVTRLLTSPREIRNILVPVENLTHNSAAPIQFAQILAEENQAQVTLLHICDRKTSTAKVAWMESQLSLLMSKWLPASNIQINVQIIPHSDVVNTIVNATKSHDLIILRSFGYRTAGGFAIGNITTQILQQQLSCSVVMLGEPGKKMEAGRRKKDEKVLSV